MSLPPAITTKEAMMLARVESYTGLKAFCAKYGIEPSHRGRENIYRKADFDRVLNPAIDNMEDPFYDHIYG